MTMVTCTTCGVALDESKADITGRGYRCASCSLKAGIDESLGKNDVADHLDPEEREAGMRRANVEILGGVALAVVCVPLILVARFATAGVFMGIVAVAHGFATRRQMRGRVVS